MKTKFVAIALALTGGIAHAGPQLTASIGQGRYHSEYDHDRVAFTQANADREFDNQTNAFTLGVRWNRFEINYHDFGQASQFGLSTHSDYGDPEYLKSWYTVTHVKALSVSFVPEYRGVYARIGVARYNADTHVRFTNGSEMTDLKLGAYNAEQPLGWSPIVGVGFTFNGFTIEATRLTNVMPRNGAINMAQSVTVGYRF